MDAVAIGFYLQALKRADQAEAHKLWLDMDPVTRVAAEKMKGMGHTLDGDFYKPDASPTTRARFKRLRIVRL